MNNVHVRKRNREKYNVAGEQHKSLDNTLTIHHKYLAEILKTKLQSRC